MAGHSKWKNIQHRKGAQDARRGKIFTKIGVEITVAVRAGGENPEDNPRLRAAIAKAKAANMPKENWQRAIKKGIGASDGAAYAEKTYEGYGPGGVAVFVTCLTDNINRTVSEVRQAFSRAGGKLGTDGSVAWMFERKGVIGISPQAVGDAEDVFELAIAAGADDLEQDDDGTVTVTCPVESFAQVRDVLEARDVSFAACEIAMLPTTTVAVDGDVLLRLEKLIAALDDQDDVQDVYHNAELP